MYTILADIVKIYFFLSESKFLELVREGEKDVFLEKYVPWCSLILEIARNDCQREVIVRTVVQTSRLKAVAPAVDSKPSCRWWVPSLSSMASSHPTASKPQ